MEKKDLIKKYLAEYREKSSQIEEQKKLLDEELDRHFKLFLLKCDKLNNIPVCHANIVDYSKTSPQKIKIES